MKLSVNWWTRKLHRWGALLTVVPLLLVITTGILLQVKKEFQWIQPPTLMGSGIDPSIAWSTILQTTIENPKSGVADWSDIDRLDVRPSKGLIKIQCKNGWEIQLDSITGEVLSTEYRRSDWIESLHDGSFFSDWTKIWVFLPNGVVLLGLWFSGVWLWYIPFAAKRKKKKRLLFKEQSKS